jgi:hypothetical protein
MEQLVLVDLKGKIDAETGKQMKPIMWMHCRARMPTTVVLSAVTLMKTRKVVQSG